MAVPVPTPWHRPTPALVYSPFARKEEEEEGVPDTQPDPSSHYTLVGTAVPGAVACPKCGDGTWRAEAAAAGEVVQCNGCRHRVAYGDVMPRVVVSPHGSLIEFSFEEDGVEGRHYYRVDPELAALIIVNAASLLRRQLCKVLAQKIVGLL